MPAYFGDLKFKNKQEEHKRRLEKYNYYKSQLRKPQVQHYRHFLEQKIVRMKKQFHI